MNNLPENLGDGNLATIYHPGIQCKEKNGEICVCKDRGVGDGLGVVVFW